MDSLSMILNKKLSNNEKKVNDFHKKALKILEERNNFVTLHH